MDDFQAFILARVLHVLAVVLWIGGVGFVTLVLIPALRRHGDESLRMMLFEQLEGRFATIAKITTLIAGLSGFYMVHVLDAWSRYAAVQFWWMHLMTFVWAIFTLVLFVFEPLFLHRWFTVQAQKNSEKTFRVMLRMHLILLTLSLVAVAGAMAGAHGYAF